MKNKLFTLILSVLTITFIITSCGSKNEPQEGTRRTIIMYLIATNSLSSSIASDISEIENTIQSTNMNNCRFLVYYATYSQNPYLFEIKKGKRGVENVTLKTYSTAIKSTSVERMQEVLKDAISIAPAKEFGLILGSHASGWANSLTSRSSDISLLDFGDDKGSTMPIHELAEAIPDNLFKFIYSDACYMGGIEVAYELKDKTEYFIGSPTELPIDGMDYANNIPCFFADSIDLIKVCSNTFNKYNNLSGSNRTCTISLVDCTKLNQLASIAHEIYHIGTGTTEYYKIQHYKRSLPYLFFDFKQYINTFTATTETNTDKLNSLITTFNSQLDNIVLYKASTPYIFGKDYLSIKSENYSGLSTYILGSTTQNGVNEIYYKNLSWYRDVIQ